MIQPLPTQDEMRAAFAHFGLEVADGEWLVLCVCCDGIMPTARPTVVICGECVDYQTFGQREWNPIYGGWRCRHSDDPLTWVDVRDEEKDDLVEGRLLPWRAYMRRRLLRLGVIPDGPCTHYPADQPRDWWRTIPSERHA